MKKRFLFWLILPLMAFTGFDWVTVSIDERVSMDFPFKPEQTEMSGNAVWMVDANSDARCMAMVIDLKNMMKNTGA